MSVADPLQVATFVVVPEENTVARYSTTDPCDGVTRFQHNWRRCLPDALPAHAVGPVAAGVTDTDDDAAPSPTLFTARRLIVYAV